MEFTTRTTSLIADVVGVWLPATGVLDDAWIDLQQSGLFALYGTNGAGKTTVLDRLAALLSPEPGRRRAGEIHLQLTDPHIPTHDAGPLGQLVKSEQLNRLDEDSVDSSRPLLESLEEALAVNLQPFLDEYYPDVTFGDDVVTAPRTEGDENFGASLAKAIAAQARLVLSPVDDGGWHVDVGVQLDASVTPLRQVFDSVVSEYRARRETTTPVIVWDVGPYGDLLLPAGTRWVEAIVADRPPPGWAAMPVWPLGTISGRARLVPRVIAESAGDPHVKTKQGLADMVEGHVLADGDDPVDEFAVLDHLSQEWASRASDALGRLMLDAPGLELDVGDPLDWRQFVFGDGPRWSARDRWSLARVRLDQLSRAERRWADVAIQMTVDTLGGVHVADPAIVLIDEPEQALHRRAERHLVDGLAWYAGQVNGRVIAATHSPSLLGHDATTSIHVRRDDRGLAVVRS
jgi:energy-coupling factor transporter ATP-binding protein EcfA2